MISIIKRLMAGDKEIVDKFSTAHEFWKNFFGAHQNDNLEKLADALGRKQTTFEMELDWDRALAKEIMPYTGIAYLYDEQNGFANDHKLARRVVLAFAQSMCSIEIKSDAKAAAQLFHIDKD